MKRTLSLLALSLVTNLVIAQTVKIVDASEYQYLKANGLFDSNVDYVLKKRTTIDPPVYFDASTQSSSEKTTQTMTGACDCMVPLDNTFQVVPMDAGFPPDYRNDDASSPLITLPFTFCFYGQNRTNLYINNNGNITFDLSYSTYSAVGFPSSQYKMIAPFWADVDTENPASGLVYYKVTPHYLIVKWDRVGYFSSQADKMNTFQLIISDGTDSLIAGNNNVSFCYGDMQWTTGSASGGTNGFGGTAATVGVNKGDGTSFIQLGRFNVAGNVYDGPYNNNDGISWLDNQSFNFNVCGNSTNLPPLAIGGNLNSCAADTIRMCANTDTINFNTSFTGPENNQTVTVTVSAPTLGTAITSSSTIANGQTNSTFQVIANPGVVGSHLITVTATDNGNPSLSTTSSYILEIPNVSLPPPTLSVNPSGVICGNTVATVTLDSCANYSNIVWNDGTTGCSVQVTQTGTVSVTVTAGAGCTKTASKPVTIIPAPTVVLSGDTNFCNNNNTILTANVSGITVPVSSYSWTNGANTQAATITSAGQVIVTVTDANGCIGKDSVVVTNITPSVTISPNVSSFCPGVPVTLTSSISSGTFVWTGGTGGPYPDANSIVVTLNNTTTFNLQVTSNGCVSTNSLTLSPLPVPTIDTIIQPIYCIGDTTSLTAVTNPVGATITWNPGNITGATITPAPGVSTYSITATVGTCTSSQYTVAVHGPSSIPYTNIIDNLPSNNDTILCYKVDKYLKHDVVTGGLSPYSYFWSPASASASTKDSLKINLPGTYYLTVTDVNGCRSKDSITIDLIQPTLNVTGNAMVCPKDTARIIAIGYSPGGYYVTWSPVGYPVNDTIYTTQAGQYTATIIDSIYGCPVSKVFTVGNYPVPTADFVNDPNPSEYDTPASFTSTSTISSGTISQCSWLFGDGGNYTGTTNTTTHVYSAPGTYSVTLIAKSNRGCTNSIQKEHVVIAIIPKVNIITTNGDAVNNALYFKGLHFFPDTKITIFNRWGNKIYESNDYKNDWTGADYESGTYYYILEIQPKFMPRDNVITNFFQLIK